MISASRYVAVALPLPVDHMFTYEVRSDANSGLAGSRVLVPLGRKKLTGVIVEEGVDPDPAIRSGRQQAQDA